MGRPKTAVARSRRIELNKERRRADRARWLAPFRLAATGSGLTSLGEDVVASSGDERKAIAVLISRPSRVSLLGPNHENRLI
jgi:hypothetical protein